MVVHCQQRTADPIRGVTFKKLCAYGRAIWADRCIEWSMKYLQSFLGKHAMQNHNEKMDRLVHDISVRVKRRSNVRNLLTRTKVATSDPLGFHSIKQQLQFQHRTLKRTCDCLRRLFGAQALPRHSMIVFIRHSELRTMMTSATAC